MNYYSIAMVSQDLNSLRTRRANIHYGKDFTVNVASRTLERKFVCNLVDIVCLCWWTKGTPLLHISICSE